jgi:hypothetical protein
MKKTTKEQLGYFLIIVTPLLAVAGISTLPPIPQDPDYHLFIDTREILSIPNFWNVVTNLPFAIIGALGLYRLTVTNQLSVIQDIHIAYRLLFFGTLLVAFGSGYYHLEPNNQTLVWDRLPMTIAFMALFALIIGEHISLQASRFLLWPLLFAGIGSVLYWHLTEGWGEGDLRLYALVQFYPMLAIPIMLVLFPSRCTHVQAYWWLLVTYIVAKLFEHFDVAVYELLGGAFSGHSLKHLFAALGVYILLIFYGKRKCR